MTGAKSRVAEKLRTRIEVSLLVTGIVLLAFFAGAQVDRFFTSTTLLEGFPATELSAHSTPQDNAVPQDPSMDSGSEPHGGLAGPTAEAAAAETLLAVLRIPSIHLEVPVLDGTDALTLNHAAGRIPGTALPGQEGNIGIAAHRDSFFRNLGKLRIGDPIALETRSGVLTYRVEQTQVVTPDDVSVLDPRTEPSLTLVTCYPFHYIGSAPQRYIVTALLEVPNRGNALSAP